MIFSWALARAEPIPLVATHVYKPESEGLERTIKREPSGRLEPEVTGPELDPVREENE